MGDELGDGPGLESDPRDGSINFDPYSDSQLKELRDNIDARRFPKNFSNLTDELRRREARRDAKIKNFAVRFTSADGIRGWLQGLLARQPFYGDGSVEIHESEIIIQGWRRTWLGFAQQSEESVPIASIRNAYMELDRIEFESKKKWLWPKRHVFRTRDSVALFQSLPLRKSRWFEKQAASAWEFYRLLRASDRQTFVTHALVAANLVVYAAMAIQTGLLGGFDGATLLSWGANYGPLTAEGQWWRLLSSAFLHINLLHVGINMWVLWSAGRLTERLYGNFAFLLIYVLGAVAGSLASIAWNPAVSGVGASGAIFGVLGAFIAYLTHGGTKVPLAIMRAHFIPTLLFILFSLGNGWLQTGIDNAAHAGGLTSGFLLGWAFARPLGEGGHGRAFIWQSVAAAMMFGAELMLLGSYVLAAAARPGPQEEYVQSHRWYADGEATNMQLWQELANRAASGTISSADLADQFQKNILPFWKDAAPRLQRDTMKLPPDQRAIGGTIADFASVRRRWAQAIIASTSSTDPARAQDAVILMQKTDLTQAHIDRLTMRYGFDRRARSLAAAPPVIGLENVFWYDHWKCVKSPFRDSNAVAPTDAPADAPARSDALACLAQQLFLTRNFVSLESLMNQSLSHLNDLPDGSSSLNALSAGLDNLFSFGGLSPEQLLDRTAEWRRTVPGSVQAEIAEAMLFEAWAYSARGYGGADTISNQNLTLFLHRMEMSAAALRAVAPRAAGNPLWYQESIYVGLYQSVDGAILQSIFDNGQKRFPDYLGLYRAMLHTLMPRWGGSYGKVNQFILEQLRRDRFAGSDRIYEKYARLYWIYSSQEGDDLDLFGDAGAKWESMGPGLALLVKDYPNSDFILNGWGKFACMANDGSEYRFFRSRLGHRYSASAWSDKISMASCNRKLSLN